MTTTLEVPVAAAPVEEFESLQARGQAAFEAGRLEESLELLGRALALAEEQGDGRRIDLAFCNLASARISFGRSDALDPATMNRLREILLRNEDLSNCRLAAYNLARAYEYKKDNRKGLFYARIALDRSQLLGRPEWIASSHNQLGNFLLAQSLFEQAAAEYESALAFVPEQSVERRASILINVAYTCLVRGERREAFRLLYRGLRLLRRLGVKRGQMFAHLDLCYAHLEANRYPAALRHGERALWLAEELAEADVRKNALYLLGEARHLAGDRTAAHRHFSRLQQEFYPGTSGIPEFLLAIDVRKIINLRA
jgi:tetratricopeptide (TPR) repeat protein